VNWRRKTGSHAAEARISIPEVWSDENGIALRGWILTQDGPPDNLEIFLGDQRIPVVGWHERPDIVAKHPEFTSGPKCGFRAYLPRSPAYDFRIEARTGDQVVSKNWTVRPEANVHAPATSEPGLLERFRSRVNDEHLTLLEIGSRVVVPGSVSKRSLFPGAASYTGFDFYPDQNTDVVGDAHRLSSFFTERFDAVLSLAVLEHLAMPWVVAMEINKVLRIGGLTFHQTHFAFPLHEQPADYWRFSEQGLRALFSPALGFEVLGCESTGPVRLHPDQRTPELLHLPTQPAFIHVAILAKKIAGIDTSKTRWEMDATPEYPAPNES